MVIFNPQNPGKPEEFGRDARPISDLSGNQSGRFAIEGVGDLISGGANLLDASLKKGLQNTIYKEVDDERDKFTTGLEQIKTDVNNTRSLTDSITQPSNVPLPRSDPRKGPVASGSWLDANAQADAEDTELPAGLESGLDRVGQLKMAQAQGSAKINDTQYAAETLAIAKRLRSQYPGYREYIDNEVSKASGLPVANSYYSNLMTDINRQLGQMAKAKDDFGTFMMKNLDLPGAEGTPNMGAYIMMRKNGNPNYPGDAEILNKVTQWKQLQSQIEVDAKLRNASTDDDKTKSKKEQANLTRNLTNMTSQYVDGLSSVSGMPTFSAIKTYFNDVNAGRIPATDTHVTERAQQLQAYRQVVYDQAQKIARGSAPIIGDDAAAKSVENALIPIDTVIKMASSKDTSPAFFAARMFAASSEDAKYRFMFNPDTAALGRAITGARGVFGDTHYETFIRPVMENGFDEGLKKQFSKEALASVTDFTDSRGKPLPRYMIDAVKDGKQAGIDDPDYFGKVSGWIERVTDPNVPMTAKDKMIEWGFNPKNRGVLNEYKMDYKDPNTGEIIPGKHRAFNLLASPGITSVVAETSKAKPENYAKYKGTLENEFGTMYRQDISQLNKLHESTTFTDAQGNRLPGTVDRNTVLSRKVVAPFGYSYDTDSKSFGIVDKNNRPITRENISFKDPNFTFYSAVLDKLEQINPSLQRMARVHDQDPNVKGNVDAYLLRTLQSSQFQPGKTIQGAGSQMAAAILKAGNPDITPEELDKRLLTITKPVPVQTMEFAPDDRRKGDLKSFISNPAGEPLPKRVRGNVVGPNETITDIRSDEIPDGMDYKTFIQQLKREGRY